MYIAQGFRNGALEFQQICETYMQARQVLSEWQMNIRRRQGGRLMGVSTKITPTGMR